MTECLEYALSNDYFTMLIAYAKSVLFSYIKDVPNGMFTLIITKLGYLARDLQHQKLISHTKFLLSLVDFLYYSLLLIT